MSDKYDEQAIDLGRELYKLVALSSRNDVYGNYHESVFIGHVAPILADAFRAIAAEANTRATNAESVLAKHYWNDLDSLRESRGRLVQAFRVAMRQRWSCKCHANAPSVPEQEIRRFANENGYAEVWRSWRDNMLRQGRDVSTERMSLATLPQQDIELDQQIAFDVILDYCVWALSHPREGE